MNEKIFPTILIILQALCSIPYFCIGEWKQGIYWIAACVLNIAVTY